MSNTKIPNSIAEAFALLDEKTNGRGEEPTSPSR